MPSRFEVSLEKPGRLVCREGNYEYTFPCYEQDGELIIVGFPTGRRVYLIFRWYVIPRTIPRSEIRRIRLRVLRHLRNAGKLVRLFSSDGENNQSFTFFPELLEARAKAIILLEDAKFIWMCEYGSIDISHDRYGLEICGIRNKADLIGIANKMRDGFPQWHYDHVSCQDVGCEPGWMFSIYMFPGSCGSQRCES